MIDGKARLVSDLFCDGLGACIGHCPQGAIAIEEREAADYDESRVMANIVRGGENVIRAHLDHLREHGETGYLSQALTYLAKQGIPVPAQKPPVKQAFPPAGCPGSKMMDFGPHPADPVSVPSGERPSQLRQWPVQLMLVPVSAPYLNNSELLIAADCVPFAYAGFHENLLKGRSLLVACPKLDDLGIYKEKLRQILEINTVRSITYAHMEVPCCYGLTGVIQEAIASSGKDIPFHDTVITISGGRKDA
ncbi:MAG: 4Fe-4S ferredoxin, partial [Candidatus Omnitrophica bacterium]|nr:4Fe-4S ferredoxin [Candidatus Omnitrophota bacterium]